MLTNATFFTAFEQRGCKVRVVTLIGKYKMIRLRERTKQKQNS